MQSVTINFLVIYSTNIIIQGLPINNGFTVKFNPISVQEQVKPKTFGALFAKILQELSPKATHRREVLVKAHSPYPPDLGTGCTNQIARIIFPLKGDENVNDTHELENLKLLNLPIIKQPFESYKILIATAPPHLKIGGDDDEKPMVIYIVFPEDKTTDSINIPTIYFVNKLNEKMYINNKTTVDPILIIDSNRTVTGLKSKEIHKFVKFKNKVADHYKYQISQ
ncbi:uncharacterized protein LOC113517928 [Galleria mellonella]|uniref:Uncharacterized protein LOC113517928 n=1 Tax=Galleria mellonella TaxID=7137 RepID=A0A6J1WZJ7_GALME|nr:uncharacterized protein LOC113517928 [Galleria mellonella]